MALSAHSGSGDLGQNGPPERQEPAVSVPRIKIHPTDVGRTHRIPGARRHYLPIYHHENRLEAFTNHVARVM